jgi:hypothetical protein
MLDSYFKIKERGSSVSQEIRGGLVTFFTMAYIVVLNPLILATDDGAKQFIGGGDRGNAIVIVAAGTALIAGVLTILMGAYANFPLALATGLGLNTFVAVSIAKHSTWAQAMGLVLIEGILILVLVLTGFRVAVFKAIPTALKIAISVGIGLFISLIGEDGTETLLYTGRWLPSSQYSAVLRANEAAQNALLNDPQEIISELREKITSLEASNAALIRRLGTARPVSGNLATKTENIKNINPIAGQLNPYTDLVQVNPNTETTNTTTIIQDEPVPTTTRRSQGPKGEYNGGNRPRR